MTKSLWFRAPLNNWDAVKNLQGRILNKHRNNYPRTVVSFLEWLKAQRRVFFSLGFRLPEKNRCCYEVEYSNAWNALVHTYHQRISKTRVKHVDKGDSVANLRTNRYWILILRTHVCAFLLFTIIDQFHEVCQVDEPRGVLVWALMVIESLYFMFVQVPFWHGSQFVYTYYDAFFIDNYLLRQFN